MESFWYEHKLLIYSQNVYFYVRIIEDCGAHLSASTAQHHPFNFKYIFSNNSIKKTTRYHMLYFL